MKCCKDTSSVLAVLLYSVETDLRPHATIDVTEVKQERVENLIAHLDYPMLDAVLCRGRG